MIDKKQDPFAEDLIEIIDNVTKGLMLLQETRNIDHDITVLATGVEQLAKCYIQAWHRKNKSIVSDKELTLNLDDLMDVILKKYFKHDRELLAEDYDFLQNDPLAAHARYFLTYFNLIEEASLKNYMEKCFNNDPSVRQWRAIKRQTIIPIEKLIRTLVRQFMYNTEYNAFVYHLNMVDQHLGNRNYRRIITNYWR